MFHLQKTLQREWRKIGFLVLKAVLHVVIVISKEFRTSTKRNFLLLCGISLGGSVPIDQRKG